MAMEGLSHLGRPDPRLYPTNVVDQLPPDCRLLNSYVLGGYVSLMRPDVLVSPDARNDLYGPDRVLEIHQVVDGGLNPEHYRARAGCVLVPPASPLAAQLATDRGWTLATADPTAVLYLRR